MPLRGRENLSGCSYFFVTTTVVNFTNIFIDPELCDILIKVIKYYQEKYKFEILSYVIMPSHFHWIIEINPKTGTISDIMRDIKKYSAWEILDIIEKKNPEMVRIFTEASKKYPGQKRKLWMSRFHDEVIRDEKMFWTKLNYIHNNPVEAGLAKRIEDYIYSSAANYKSGNHSVLQINIGLAGINIV